ncbi:MAG TPA: protein kinase [Flavobacteriaceae bacterium]|nr:protein kinase [Flavobacteriaceae bacterium]
MNKKIGDNVRIASIGGSAKIISELGKGGQGTVFKVDFGGQHYALKWYHKLQKPAFYDNLKDNIAKGAPNKHFLWPLFLTEKDRDGHFGYLMDIRKAEHRDFSQFLLAKERFSSVEALIQAGINICLGFRELHNKGYSYQDLNDGNFFINPKDGDVLICDNDNVSPSGKNTGIKGKCRYMAPEVVLGKLPDTQSDRYSLSVILFLLLFNNHPLEGERIAKVACMTEKNEKKFYGSEPVFIYDKTDASNRPLPYVHQNVVNRWNIFPQYLRDAFIRQFSKDLLKNPGKRQTEKEWLDGAILRLRNDLTQCPACKTAFFLEAESVQTSLKCINKRCNNTFNSPPQIVSGKNKVAVYAQKVICANITDQKSEDINRQTGLIVESAKTPGLFGLRNLSDGNWILTTKNGENRTIEPKATCPLLVGNQINFGNGSHATISI